MAKVIMPDVISPPWIEKVFQKNRMTDRVIMDIHRNKTQKPQILELVLNYKSFYSSLFHDFTTSSHGQKLSACRLLYFQFFILHWSANAYSQLGREGG